MGEEELTMEVWQDRIQQDINDIKQRQQQSDEKMGRVQSDVHKLQVSDQLQNKEIETLKQALFEIKEDTNWIRRKITGAIITASITAIIAGVIGVIIANIF